jgi:tetratricopeptide (TPR) repeat protein
VEHVFGEVIAELDPHYVDAYWLGALIMTVEAKDLAAGLRLLDKGIAANPDKWILPYLAAWESYRAGDYQRAADYFRRAAEVPDAPPAVMRMRAGMISKAGDLKTALSLWRQVLEDPRSDEASVEIARRQVRDLQLRSDLRDLQSAVNRFRIENGRLPESLESLLRRGYIRVLPRDPDDREYLYDPRTGAVSSKAGRVLGGA